MNDWYGKYDTRIMKDFAKECKDKVWGILTVWCRDCNCYFDNSQYAIKQFVLTASHSWGTAYCYWNEDDKREIKKALSELGAVNIKFNTFKFNYVYITFNIRKSLYKKLSEGIDISN